MNRYNVRIILDSLDIVAESEERANEIAVDIMNSDARTHLDHGFGVVDFDTDLLEENIDEAETEL